MGLFTKLKERKQRKVFFKEVEREGRKSITINVPDEGRVEVANDTHPRYATIVERAKLDDPTVVDLIDSEAALAKQFQKLSDRIAVRDGKVFLDGDEIHNKLTENLLATLEAGADFKPLVLFMERLMNNPLGHAKEALYPWITGNGSITLTEDGKVVGYKSMTSVIRNGETYYRPSQTGAGVVNGIEVDANEYIYQQPGDVVEMPRNIVLHAPSTLCAEGLHIGTWGYAQGFRGDAKMEVHFDPRDVVSVPNNGNKIRVCRYTLVGPVKEPHKAPVIPARKVKPNAPKEQPVRPKPPTPTAPPVVTTTANTFTVTGASDTIINKPRARVRYPKPDKFEALLAEAKSKKKGFQKYAEAKTTWTLEPGGDPKNRKDWRA